VTRLAGVASEVADAEWDRVVSEAPQSTFFATRAYARACESAFPNMRAVPRLYRFDDGVEVLLPGVVEAAAGGAVRAFKSVPPSEYAGMVTASRLNAGHIQVIATDLKHAGFSRVVVYDSPFTLHPAMPGFKATPDFTHVLDVSGGLEGVLHNMNPQTRQAMHKVMKSDLRVESRSDERAMEEFYRLYLVSVQRWGEKTTWVRPLEYLRALVLNGGDSVRIRMAYLDDRAIGGQVDYFHGAVCTTAWRAFDYDYRAHYPYLLTLNASLVDARESGLRCVDLGPSSGLEGVETTKDRCGARRVGFRVWTWDSAGYRLYQVGRRGLDRVQASVCSAAHR
jgi:hypothetical protein